MMGRGRREKERKGTHLASKGKVLAVVAVQLVGEGADEREEDKSVRPTSKDKRKRPESERGPWQRSEEGPGSNNDMEGAGRRPPLLVQIL